MSDSNKMCGSNSSSRPKLPRSDPIMIPCNTPIWMIDRSIDLRYPPVISAEPQRTSDNKRNESRGGDYK